MGQRVTTRERTDNRPIEPPSLPEPQALARLVYDDQSGRQSHDVVKHSVTIGRGGTTYPVDVRIVSSPDVSREHARIRRDPESGRFFLIDLSSLGTSLNGRPVPCGYDDMDGSKRENGHETPLPDGARIGLADTVFMDFRIVP
jgi:pSer/pThr/pTyr-binding forkhead associated (FHA) protein